ncbi:MAG: hypothetical protein ACQESK_03240 [Bacteroidota bacterium]
MNEFYSDSTNYDNKKIPKSIEKETKIALSHYPELEGIEIEFRFKKNLKKSIMNAQPRFWDLFKIRKKRSYYIHISETFSIEDEEFKITEIPSDVLIGWLGHELGHIKDYQHRSALNMVWFGVKYTLSSGFIREAERIADTYAVNNGMGEFIIVTKNFILNHTHLTNEYKERIKRLYLSPDEIMHLIDELENSGEPLID